MHWLPNPTVILPDWLFSGLVVALALSLIVSVGCKMCSFDSYDFWRELLGTLVVSIPIMLTETFFRAHVSERAGFIAMLVAAAVVFGIWGLYRNWREKHPRAPREYTLTVRD
ncbi:hypothetical protein JNJ66_06160 [Candidatus Saccharibacteria bacterium]|nr:hypothetical protein [Candidatus Saccharibacteria bacterium]